MIDTDIVFWALKQSSCIELQEILLDVLTSLKLFIFKLSVTSYIILLVKTPLKFSHDSNKSLNLSNYIKNIKFKK